MPGSFSDKCRNRVGYSTRPYGVYATLEGMLEGGRIPCNPDVARPAAICHSRLDRTLGFGLRPLLIGRGFGISGENEPSGT